MQTLIHFKSFVDEITATNSRIEKESILNQYKDDLYIKFYLNFLLDPYITTGISDKKVEQIKNLFIFSDSFKPENILEDLCYIMKHNTGTADVLNMIKCILNSFTQFGHAELKDFFLNLISKNLPLGVDAKTVNKIIPGLIPTFNVMLSNKYFDNPAIVEGKKFWLTTKIDGGRIVAMKENGEVSFWTRQGQKYEGLVDLEQEMSEHMEDGTCLDGEISLLDKGSLTSKEQYKETMKIVRRNGIKHGVKMIVFDIMTVSEFRAQKCLTPYWKRHFKLEDMFDKFNYTYFDLVPTLYCGSDTSEIIKWLNYNIEHGEEGIMINISDAPYEFCRTNSLLKVKKMKDLDLECVGFEEGTKRHKGRLGALLVKYKENIVKVGSGFSDDLREEIWAHRDEWMGRTIVVQYFEETTNADGGVSLRFPVYIDYREDK